MKRADVVVLGGGHNGLTAAAYLARAGRSVVVVEALPQVGGTASTEEFAPGFRASSVYPSAEMFHPDIARELGLDQYGLRWLRPSTSVLVPRPDGPALRVPASANGGAGALEPGPAGDAALDDEALRDFDAFLGRMARVLEPVLTRPLPRLEPEGIGDAFELLRVGLKLRGLGRREMPEAMRLLPMCLRDALNERFTDEALKAALALPALRATWLAPRSPGGALGLVYHRPAWTAGLLAPPAFVEGGLGRLSGALADAARRAGAEVLTATRATAIRVDRGRAVAVEVEDDDGTFEIGATALVSALHPKTTLLRLVEPRWLDPEVATAVDAMRSRGTVAVVKLALQGLPTFPDVEPPRATPDAGNGAGNGHASSPGSTGPADGAAALSGRVQIGHRLDDLERAFDAAKYGRLPRDPVLDVTFPSILDPGLAPEGKHVAHVWVQYVPYRLEDGVWSGHRDELGDLVLRTLEGVAPGFGAAVLHRHVLTPADLEQRYGLVDGCPHHAELALDQMLYMRPIPGWYRHRTPVHGLYLCGPGSHPGGGVTGLPGRNAARRLLADWKDGALETMSG